MRLDEALRNFISYVQIVENRIAGDTREHPHVNDEPEVDLEVITTHLFQAPILDSWRLADCLNHGSVLSPEISTAFSSHGDELSAR